MAHAEKRDGKLTGSWIGEVDQRHKSGPRFRRRFDTKAKAVGYEAYVRATGEEPPGIGDGDSVSGRTFASVAAECKEAGGPSGAWKRERDDSVLTRLNALCNMPLGQMPIERIAYADLQDLVASLEKRPGQRAGSKMAPGTINRYLTAVSAVMSYAVSMRYRKDTPEIPWRREAKQGRFHWLTDEQERVVRRVLEDHGFAVESLCVRVLTATGLRWSEFFSLEHGQIEDHWIRLWETKTDTPRSVPIVEDLARELRANVVAQRLPKYDTFHERLARAVKVAGYDSGLTPHCLRHTTCTRLINSGLSLPKVQRLMGHKSIQTTMRYFHMLDDDLADVANILSPRAVKQYTNAYLAR